MWKKTEMVGLIGSLLVILMPILSTNALSQVEPFGVYEDWENPEIRPDRWGTGRNDDSLEVKREIHGNRLEMKYRVIGSSRIYQNRLYAKNPSTISQIEATFKVVSLFIENCDENYFTNAVPALIDLALFNDGSSSAAGDETGDYFARVLVHRQAISTDRDDVLAADAYLYRCADSSCSGLELIQSKTDMGRVLVGKKFTLRIIWDKLRNQLFVGLNGHNVPLADYSRQNLKPANVPFSTIRIRMELGYCPSGSIEGEATTQVYTIRTNRSAVIH